MNNIVHRCRRLFPAKCAMLPSSTATIRLHSALPFKIPNRIERSPTDLLQALSDTVGIDTTAPHYAFIDDPILIPTSFQRKKEYFLCKEYGRRAARQLVEEWPTLFMFDRDKPRLAAYRPEKPLDPLVVEATAANLAQTIHARRVEDAVRLHARCCTDANVQLDADLERDFFHLICYYNGKDVPLDELDEWYGARNFYDKFNVPSTHEKGGLIDQMFDRLEKDEALYSTMICHLCKFGDSEDLKRVEQLFVEMLQKKFTPHEEVFNALIQLKHVKYLSLLEKMNELGVRPTTRTFNAALRHINANISIEIYETMKEKNFPEIRAILNEMNRLNLKPNLSIFFNILTIVSAHDIPNYSDNSFLARDFLREMLTYLEALPEIQVAERDCQNFWYQAIKFSNSDLATRVEALKNSPKNKVILNAAFLETRYYNRYFAIMRKNMNSKQLYNLYIDLFVRVLNPSVRLMPYFWGVLKEQPYWPLLRRLMEDSLADGTFTPTAFQWFEFLEKYPLESLNADENEQFMTIITRILYAIMMENLKKKTESIDVELLISRIPILKDNSAVKALLESFAVREVAKK